MKVKILCFCCTLVDEITITLTDKEQKFSTSLKNKGRCSQPTQNNEEDHPCRNSSKEKTVQGGSSSFPLTPNLFAECRGFCAQV